VEKGLGFDLWCGSICIMPENTEQLGEPTKEEVEKALEHAHEEAGVFSKGIGGLEVPKGEEKTGSVKASFENGIKGLERLELLKPPAEGTSEEPAGTLSPKVRRSIERKIINRQDKIESALIALSAVRTPADARKLLDEEKRLEEITKLVAEQAEIAEKESLSNIDHRPFLRKMEEVEKIQRELVQKLHSGDAFDIPTEVEKFKITNLLNK